MAETVARSPTKRCKRPTLSTLGTFQEKLVRSWWSSGGHLLSSGGGPPGYCEVLVQSPVRAFPR